MRERPRRRRGAWGRGARASGGRRAGEGGAAPPRRRAAGGPAALPRSAGGRWGADRVCLGVLPSRCLADAAAPPPAAAPAVAFEIWQSSRTAGAGAAAARAVQTLDCKQRRQSDGFFASQSSRQTLCSRALSPVPAFDGRRFFRPNATSLLALQESRHILRRKSARQSFSKRRGCDPPRVQGGGIAS